MTNRDIEKGVSFIEKMERLTDLPWMCDYNLSFHLSLYRPAATAHLLKMIQHAHYVSHRYVHASYWAGNSAPASQEEHRQIREACRDRDAKRARALSRSLKNMSLKDSFLRLRLVTGSGHFGCYAGGCLGCSTLSSYASINLGMLARLQAAIVSVNWALTRSTPRSMVCAIGPTVFTQPNVSSIFLRQRFDVA
ncbi:Hypothetical protein NGAL_HAMBI2610_56790 [Neorhizobium galegae bv. orientalis]|nr:Hypothetical protein NGAL_HAMBI2610_56790 [Neorhizobium galegae bv. orientalis]